MLGDALLELDERCDPAAPCPRDPSVQRLGGLVCWELEDGTQAFFEQIGAVEPRISLGDPRKLRLLLVGEVLGVLPQRVAGVLERERVRLRP